MSRAVVLAGPGDLSLQTRDTPPLRAGEVLVRVAWAGICGSDVDLRDGGRHAPLARYPVVPGHEWSGVVEAVGEGVDLRLVERSVVGENIRPCSSCPTCLAGDATSCQTGYEETGFTLDGAWADHVVVPAALLHVLRDDADLRSAAGLEPAACAAAAVARAELQPGQRVAVVGGGTIGLLVTQLARAAETDVTVVDPQPAKADLAALCGAVDFLSPLASREQASSFDVVLEAAGAIGTAAAAVRLARRGGRVVLCGHPPDGDVLPTADLMAGNLELRTVFGASSHAWRQALLAFAAGVVDPGLLVTHELSLEDAAAGLDLVAAGGPDVGKVLLHPWLSDPTRT